MLFHVIIAVERRKSTEESPRDLSIKVAKNWATSDEEPDDITVQLHTLTENAFDINDANILYVAAWDGESSSIEVLKDEVGRLNMKYAGWPDAS